MIFRFPERMNGMKIKSIRSARFPNVYLRCDGKEATEPTVGGAGIVNCQYKPPDLCERYFVYPVEMTPSLALHSTCTVVIESAHFRNVFIRMDSKGMSQFELLGADEVTAIFA